MLFGTLRGGLMSNILEVQCLSWERSKELQEGQIVDHIEKTKIKNTLQQARQRSKKKKHSQKRNPTEIFLTMERGRIPSFLAMNVARVAMNRLLKEGYFDVELALRRKSGYIYFLLTMHNLWPFGYKRRKSGKVTKIA